MATLKYKDSQGNIKTARVAVTTKVPPLDNPATTDDVVSGKEFIDENGEKKIGVKQDVIDWIQYAKSIQLAFSSTEFPYEDVTMHLESVTSTGLYQSFRGASGVKNLTLYVGDNITSLARLADASASIEKITIVGNLSNVSTYSSMVNSSRIKELDADIDFSSVATSSGAFNITCNYLTTVRFVPNTLSVSIKFGSKVFTDETLVSYANTLKTGTTGTVTWSSESKSRAEAILGTVSQVTEGDETYDFFTADEYGDTTLTQFITQVKGWTLA